MTFLYFLPNAKPSEIPTQLSKWGLGYLFDEATTPAVYSRECTGPENQRGIVIGSSTNWEVGQVKMPTGEEAGRAPLTWKKFPKTFADEQAWIGFDKTKLSEITPAKLARAKQVSGEYLTLADENRWLVPIARRVTGLANLPISYSLDEETGDWVADQVVPKYRKIWDHANKYMQEMLQAIEDAATNNSSEVKWSIPDGNALVADSLQVNYRVSAMELSILGVLTTGIHQQIADVLIDNSGWAEIKKKEEAATGAG